jgi:hypothetical protein
VADLQVGSMPYIVNYLLPLTPNKANDVCYFWECLIELTHPLAIGYFVMLVPSWCLIILFALCKTDMALPAHSIFIVLYCTVMCG